MDKENPYIENLPKELDDPENEEKKPTILFMFIAQIDITTNNVAKQVKAMSEFNPKDTLLKAIAFSKTEYEI